MKTIYLSGSNESLYQHKTEILVSLDYIAVDLYQLPHDFVSQEDLMRQKIRLLLSSDEIAFIEDWRSDKSSIMLYDLAKRLKIPMKFFNGDKLEDVPQAGVKYDYQKLKWNLVDLQLFRGMISVLMFGALKYENDNWKRVENAEKKYYDALMRHTADYRNGKEFDDETGLPIIYSIQANAYFLAYFEETRNGYGNQTENLYR